MSRSTGGAVRDADLQARIDELERRLGTHQPMPEAQTLASSARRADEDEMSAAEAQRARMTKEERKKQEKSARKAASFMEKTELHPSKQYGIVGPQDRLIVPSYSINGGADIKWEARPFVHRTKRSCTRSLSAILSHQVPRAIRRCCTSPRPVFAFRGSRPVRHRVPFFLINLIKSRERFVVAAPHQGPCLLGVHLVARRPTRATST
jgi:hypothetical protein